MGVNQVSQHLSVCIPYANNSITNNLNNLTQNTSHLHPQPALKHIDVGNGAQFLHTVVDLRNIKLGPSPDVELVFHKNRSMQPCGRWLIEICSNIITRNRSMARVNTKGQKHICKVFLLKQQISVIYLKGCIMAFRHEHVK